MESQFEKESVKKHVYENLPSRNSTVLSKKCHSTVTKKVKNFPMKTMLSETSMKLDIAQCSMNIAALKICKNEGTKAQPNNKPRIGKKEFVNKNTPTPKEATTALLFQESFGQNAFEKILPTHGQEEQTVNRKERRRTRKVVKKITTAVNNKNAEVNNESDGKENKDGIVDKKKTDKQGIKKKKERKRKRVFPELLGVEEAKVLLAQDPKNEQYIEGYIQINRKFNKHAYICIDEDESDLLIPSILDRNQALEGDLVIARIHPEEQWRTLSSGQKQKTGTVICIVEKLHLRKTVGFIKQQKQNIVFYPRDQRLPLLHIHPASVPKAYKKCSDAFANTLFLAEITKWRIPFFAEGKIQRIIGESGDIAAETNAILLEHGLDTSPYKSDITKDLPNDDYVINDIDMKDREDWRTECIFTIDPSTAVDLDDAVSCKLLDNGNYEVGVHIADVTHFLEFLSPLDIEVAKRATTVYMTDSVYHMLPKRLCDLCSLLPGQDKLAFSVIWEMTEKAEIIKHRFAKTIIKSCCQMSYKHAQAFIEIPKHSWPKSFLNTNGNYTISELSNVVNELYKLSVHLRSRRFENGALEIGQPKLLVLIDKSTGLPTSYATEEQQDSNRLIEEFMLLANMTVATHLYATIPDTALLRNHKEPTKRILHITKTMLEKFGIHLNIDSAGALESSLRRYEMKVESEPEEIRSIIQYRMMVINRLCVKAMARAMYKCSSTVQEEAELRHYALNVPLYTHFTSPIRRYIDCVVHRLLYSSIRNIPLTESWTRKLCIQIASNCNIKKYNAKLAQEDSCNLYFAYLVSLTGPFVALAVALEVRDRGMDLILCNVGIKLTIYFIDIKDNATVEFSNDPSSVPTAKITWKEPAVTQVVNVFTLLHIRLEKHPQHFRLNAVLLPPSKD